MVESKQPVSNIKSFQVYFSYEKRGIQNFEYLFYHTNFICCCKIKLQPKWVGENTFFEIAYSATLPPSPVAINKEINMTIIIPVLVIPELGFCDKSGYN